MGPNLKVLWSTYPSNITSIKRLIDGQNIGSQEKFKSGVQSGAPEIKQCSIMWANAAATIPNCLDSSTFIISSSESSRSTWRKGIFAYPVKV